MERKLTKRIQVGPVAVGGGAPVSIQSMLNTRTTDVEGSLAQIRALAAAGCEIARLAVPDMEAAEAFGDVMDYCMGRRPDFAAGVLPFSAEGAGHFADVRGLFLLAVWVFVAAAGLLLAGAVVCRLRRQRLPRLGGRTPGFWAACGLGGLFLLIALLAALDFDGAFTVFHSIFFPGKDNWLFDPVTDPVILILPEAFFRNCAIAIVTVLLTVCIMLVVTGRKRPSCRSAPGEGTAS